MKLNKKGFSFIELIILVVVFASVGVLGWYGYSRVQNNKSGNGQSNNDSSNKEVVWRGSGDGWSATGGEAPDCGTGPEFEMPVDIDKVTAVLYPGQKRGGDYKAHGGFLFGNNQQNEIDVRIPIDSHLIKASRYIEQGEVQYFMVFSVPCGFAYRFDHLLTLTPEFQVIMKQLPEARVDDSRTTDIQPAIKVSKGTKIATGVGFKTNTGVDFGVYDVRQPNASSNQSDYAKEHANNKEFNYYGVCFIDYLDETTATTLKSLPGGDSNSGKTSDYCK